MVHRLLATGDDDQLDAFHFRARFRLNSIERRGQTVFYTCLAEDLADAIELAKLSGITLQEILPTSVKEDPASYPVLAGDLERGWKYGPDDE